jgi:hypothetical protein
MNKAENAKGTPPPTEKLENKMEQGTGAEIA